MIIGLAKMLHDNFQIDIKNYALFDEAFTHASYVNEHPKENLKYYERIEFLGDAVMQLCVSEYLFKRYPNLPEGKKISVTIAGTDKYNDQMVVEAQTSPRTSLRYQIISDDGELIETNASTGAAGVGKEVVSFTENGTKQYQIKPVISGRYEYGVAYTGSITFGIEVADAE